MKPLLIILGIVAVVAAIVGIVNYWDRQGQEAMCDRYMDTRGDAISDYYDAADDVWLLLQAGVEDDNEVLRDAVRAMKGNNGAIQLWTGYLDDLGCDYIVMDFTDEIEKVTEIYLN